MFNAKSKAAFDESPAGASTIIGAGTVITGDISSKGDIRIDGTLKGNLEARAKVLIGPEGVVEGDIQGMQADDVGPRRRDDAGHASATDVPRRRGRIARDLADVEGREDQGRPRHGACLRWGGHRHRRSRSGDGGSGSMQHADDECARDGEHGDRRTDGLPPPHLDPSDSSTSDTTTLRTLVRPHQCRVIEAQSGW